MPSAKKDRDRLFKYIGQHLPGIFVGYDQKAGGGFSGDLLLVDWDEMQDFDSPNALKDSLRRVSAAEVLAIRGADGLYKFPCQEGRLKQGTLDDKLDDDERYHRRKRLERKPVGRPPGRKNNPKDPVIEGAIPRSRDPSGQPDADEVENDDDKDDDDKIDPGVVPSRDYWTIRGHYIEIHHVDPRTTLYDPSTDPDLPLPLKYLDIYRETRTHIEEDRYMMPTKEIIDVWYRAPGIPQHDPMPEPWTGSTRFYLLAKKPAVGWTNLPYGRVTKIRKSDKPPYMWPEEWSSMSAADQRKAMAKWIPYKKIYDAARNHRKRWHLDDDELADFELRLKEAETAHKRIPDAPAMSVYVDHSDSETTIPDGVSLDDFSDSDYMSVHSVDLGGAGTDPEDTHEHKIKDKFHCNIEWFANVHAPISIPQAMKIPKAKAALDKEWNK